MTDGATVAVVGVGRMGAAMAKRLRSRGADVVVFNRTRARAEEVAAETGADLADTAREAAARAGVVLVSLADDRAVAEAYGGADGMVAGLKRDTIVADTSTIAAPTAQRMARLVESTGARHLDAPVSGSVPTVQRGELTIMAGGRVEDVEAARPVFDLLAKKIFHMGGHGTGAAMKLAVNAVIGGLNQALSEALVLAERAAIERASAYDVFASSAIAAPFVLYKREAFEHPDETPVAFSLELVAKDLDLIIDLAHRVGAPMDQAVANKATADAAIQAGFGGADLSAIAEFLRQRAGPPAP